jgi:hypothetical protein
MYDDHGLNLFPFDNMSQWLNNNEDFVYECIDIIKIMINRVKQLISLKDNKTKMRIK